MCCLSVSGLRLYLGEQPRCRAHSEVCLSSRKEFCNRDASARKSRNAPENAEFSPRRHTLFMTETQDSSDRRSATERSEKIMICSMNGECTHTDQIREVTPSSDGCEDCRKSGDTWHHLRLCMTCGQVGCCDSSKNKHATKHFHQTQHPIIKSFQPDEDWGWCYVDELMLDEL